MTLENCLARTRIYGASIDSQAFREANAHPYALDLEELSAAWPVLPATLRLAVLEIVRSFMVATEGSRR